MSDPRVDVATNLRRIEEMAARLEAEAIHKASHHLMPGGPAMVALGPVANLEAWENLTQASERYQRAYTSAEDEDPEQSWPPFQLLRFWSEAWRRERDADYLDNPTIATEANWLRWQIEWAWENEPAFGDFAADVATAASRLEEITRDGVRPAAKGVPCLYDECKGLRIIRLLEPHGEKGIKRWRLTNWFCPSCHRTWDEDAYARMVTAANEAAKVETIEGEMWAHPEYAARVTGAKAGTVRVWLTRGLLDTVCVLAGRRQRFVRVEQVREKVQPDRRAS
jgi:hypothetical protein